MVQLNHLETQSSGSLPEFLIQQMWGWTEPFLFFFFPPEPFLNRIPGDTDTGGPGTGLLRSPETECHSGQEIKTAPRMPQGLFKQGIHDLCPDTTGRTCFLFQASEGSISPLRVLGYSLSRCLLLLWQYSCFPPITILRFSLPEFSSAE